MSNHAKNTGATRRGASASLIEKTSSRASSGTYASLHGRASQTSKGDLLDRDEAPEGLAAKAYAYCAPASATSSVASAAFSKALQLPVGPSGLSHALPARVESDAINQHDQENVVPHTPEPTALAAKHADKRSLAAAGRSAFAGAHAVVLPVVSRTAVWIAQGTSVVRELVQATGTGISDAIVPAAKARKPSWRTRSFNRNMESQVTLKLRLQKYNAICVQVAFSGAATLPSSVRFAHAAGPSGPFKQLGTDVSLESEGDAKLKHSFVVGTAQSPVQQYLRIAFVGHLYPPGEGAHDVRSLEVLQADPRAPTSAAGPPAATASAPGPLPPAMPSLSPTPPSHLKLSVPAQSHHSRLTSPAPSPLQPILNERYTSPAVAKAPPTSRPRYEQQASSATTDVSRTETREKGKKVQVKLVDTASSRAHAASQFEVAQHLHQQHMHQQLYQPLVRGQSFPAPSGPPRARPTDPFARSLMGLGSSTRHVGIGGSNHAVAAAAAALVASRGPSSSSSEAAGSSGDGSGSGLGKRRSVCSSRKFMQLHTPIPEGSESNLATPLDQEDGGSSQPCHPRVQLPVEGTADSAFSNAAGGPAADDEAGSPMRRMALFGGSCSSLRRSASMAATVGSHAYGSSLTEHDLDNVEVERGSSAGGSVQGGTQEEVDAADDDVSAVVSDADGEAVQEVVAGQQAAGGALGGAGGGCAPAASAGAVVGADGDLDLTVVRQYAISALGKMLGQTPNSQRIRSRLPSMSLPEAMREYAQRTSSASAAVTAEAAAGSLPPGVDAGTSAQSATPGRAHGAPPPPPPPPPFGMAAGAVTPEQRQPSMPTTKFHWTKVPTHAAKNSVWSEMTPVKVDVDYSALEAAFAVVVQPARGTASSSKAAKAATATIIDGKRAQNIAIRLSKFRPLTPPQIVANLVRMTTTAEAMYDEDQLEALIEMLPAQEERKKLAAYKGDRACLCEADDFLVEMLPFLDDLAPKMRMCIAMASMPRRLEVLLTEITVVRNACSEVRTSSLMKHLLKLALDVGNFLNASSPQGAAIGFHLETLLRLRDARSTVNKGHTLLHFVAREQLRQCPDEFLEEQLQSCQAASKLCVAGILDELRGLRARLDELRAGLPEGEACEPASPFQDAAQEFVVSAAAAMAEAEAAGKEAERQFLQLRSYLNGSTDKTEMPRFFFVLHAFTLDLAKAHAENAAFDERAARAKLLAERTPLVRGGAGARGATRSAPASDPGPKAHILSSIRAFSRLRPADRKAMLTEKGARDRMRRENITVRQSIAHLPPRASQGMVSARATTSRRVPAGGRILEDQEAPDSADSSTQASLPGLGNPALVEGLQQFNREALLRLSMPADMLKAAFAQTRLGMGRGSGGGGGGGGRRGSAGGSAAARSPSSGGIGRIPEEAPPQDEDGDGDAGGLSPTIPSRHMPFAHHRSKSAIPPKLDLSKLRMSAVLEPGSNRIMGVRLSLSRQTPRIKTLITPRLRQTRTPRLPCSLLASTPLLDLAAGRGLSRRPTRSPSIDEGAREDEEATTIFGMLPGRHALPMLEEDRTPSPRLLVRQLELVQDDGAAGPQQGSHPAAAEQQQDRHTAAAEDQRHKGGRQAAAERQRQEGGRSAAAASSGTQTTPCFVHSAAAVVAESAMGTQTTPNSHATPAPGGAAPHTCAAAVGTSPLGSDLSGGAFRCVQPGGHATQPMARASLVVQTDAGLRRRSSQGGSQGLLPSSSAPSPSSTCSARPLVRSPQGGQEPCTAPWRRTGRASEPSTSTATPGAAFSTPDAAALAPPSRQRQPSRPHSASQRGSTRPGATTSGRVAASFASPQPVPQAPSVTSTPTAQLRGSAAVSIGQKRSRSQDIFSIPMPSIVDRDEHPALLSASKRSAADRTSMLPQGGWDVPPPSSAPGYDPRHDAPTASSSNPSVTPMGTPAKDSTGAAEEGGAAAAAAAGNGAMASPGRSRPAGSATHSGDRAASELSASELTLEVSTDTFRSHSVRAGGQPEPTAGVHDAVRREAAEPRSGSAPGSWEGVASSFIDLCPANVAWYAASVRGSSEAGGAPALQAAHAAAQEKGCAAPRAPQAAQGAGHTAAPAAAVAGYAHATLGPMMQRRAGKYDVSTAVVPGYSKRDFMPMQLQLRAKAASQGGGMQQGPGHPDAAVAARKGAAAAAATGAAGGRVASAERVENKPAHATMRSSGGSGAGSGASSGAGLRVVRPAGGPPAEHNGSAKSDAGAPPAASDRMQLAVVAPPQSEDSQQGGAPTQLVTPLREINTSAVNGLNAIGPLQRGLMRGQPAPLAPMDFVGPLAFNLAARRAQQPADLRSSWGEAPAPAWQAHGSNDWDSGDGRALATARGEERHTVSSMSYDSYRPVAGLQLPLAGKGVMLGSSISTSGQSHETYTVSATTPVAQLLRPARQSGAGGPLLNERDEGGRPRRATVDGAAAGSSGGGVNIADVRGELQTGERGMQPIEPGL